MPTPQAASVTLSTETPSVTTRFSRPRFALLVLIGVYPLITALLYVIMPLTDGWAIWQRTLVIAPLMVATMIWGLIPSVHAYFGKMLHVPA